MSTVLKRLVLFASLCAAAVVLYLNFGQSITLDRLASQEQQLREFQLQNPATVLLIAFLVYVILTGLSLPGATVLTLVYGWYFGWPVGVVLVSFASTAGATFAFLGSRYFFRDLLREKFSSRAKAFDSALAREGPFYLFTLRLIPAFPFFIINVVMGLTPLSVRTFWWVSQLGMFPATVVFVYAGASVPDLQTLADQGVAAVFTPTQMLRFFVAFALIGLLPIAFRFLLARFAPAKAWEEK